MPMTAKGVPYPQGSDLPNVPGDMQALAEWVDTALTGTDQQVLTADPLQATGTRFRFPRARTAAPTPTGGLGDLWVPSSGPLAGQLHVHNGTAFVPVRPDLTGIEGDIAGLDGRVDNLEDQLPRGLIARAAMNDTFAIPDAQTDIPGLAVSFTGVAGRAYVVRVTAPLTVAGGQAHVVGRVTNGFNAPLGLWVNWATTAPGPNPNYLSMLASSQTQPIAVAGAITVKARVHRLVGAGSANVQGTSDGGASIQVFDVGLLP